MLNGMEATQRGSRPEVEQPLQQAALDGIVNIFDCAVGEYEETVRRLNCTLEAPKPTEARDQAKVSSPQTVQEAFHHMYDRMTRTTMYLNGIIERLQEQVGELKILP